MATSSPLVDAVLAGDKDMVEVLLNQGAATDTADAQGRTPLSLAARAGLLEVVELLLNQGAAVDAADAWGCTPLYYAAQHGHLEVATLLLAKHAAVDAADTMHRTPLWCALGHVSVLQLLLNRGATVDATDVLGNTPLRLAALDGRLEAARMLLSRGATVNIYTTDCNPLQYALIGFGPHDKMIKVLLAAAWPVAMRMSAADAALGLGRRQAFAFLARTLRRDAAGQLEQLLQERLGYMAGMLVIGVVDAWDQDNSILEQQRLADVAQARADERANLAHQQSAVQQLIIDLARDMQRRHGG